MLNPTSKSLPKKMNRNYYKARQSRLLDLQGMKFQMQIRNVEVVFTVRKRRRGCFSDLD